MKEIALTQGEVALVDDEDYTKLARYKWMIVRGKDDHVYAGRAVIVSSKRTMELMHRVILGARNSDYCDHINGKGLDNRRSNLRLCTHSQNMANRGPQKNNTSGYKGVSMNGAKWRAVIMYKKRSFHLGNHDTREEAAHAYNEKAIELFREFAWLNEV